MKIKIGDKLPSSQLFYVDQNNDVQWQNAEKLTVLESDIERKSDQHKIATMFYLDYFNNIELSFGHEYNFQHGYMPFDAGLNFIDYTVGSLWTKFSSNSFFVRLDKKELAKGCLPNFKKVFFIRYKLHYIICTKIICIFKQG